MNAKRKQVGIEIYFALRCHLGLLVDQLRDQQFVLIQQALLHLSDLKYRANRAIFKHLHW